MTAFSELNFRDLGGIRLADGRVLRSGKLYRSEGPASFGAADVAALGELGFRLICDLRSAGERVSAPHAWRHDARLLEIDINDDLRDAGAHGWEGLKVRPSADAARDAMRLNYARMPAALQPHLDGLANAIAGGDTPVMIHCTAGKDRTGVLVALLLAALGARREAIDADYLLSRGLRRSAERDRPISELFETMLGFPPHRAVMDVIMTVETGFLDGAFEAVASRWGSVDRYFTDAGVDAAQMEAMREILAE